MINTTNITLFFAGVTTALMAGLYFAWSCSVIPGLQALPDAGYIAAMQAMNRAIQNGAFFLAFMGAAILLPVSAWMSFKQGASVRCWLLLAATVLYLVGSIGITMFGNVPLNDALDAFRLSSASPADMAAFRLRFEDPWITLHTIRTVLTILSACCMLAAFILPSHK